MKKQPFLRKFFGRSRNIDRTTQSDAGSIELAGMTLEQLRESFRHDLFDEYLPYLEKNAVDNEFGGFMCNSYPDGTRIDTNKRSWYEGRGLWLYAYLHNKITQNQTYIDFAAKTADFILGLKPDGNVFFPGMYTRDGKPISGGEIYGDLFIAFGLQELSKAPGYERYRAESKALLMKCLRIYDRPDYTGKPFIPGPDIIAPRMLGHWMVLIRVATQFLEAGPDDEVEALADRCIDALINYHYNPDYGLFNEVLNHDFSRTEPDNIYTHWSYTGHAIEVLWFLIDEALRRKDNELFDTAANLFKHHVEVAWDSVFGGVFRSLDDVMKNLWTLDVVLLFQLEALVGCVLLVEHTGSQWSKDWYSRFYHFIKEKFEPVQGGFSPWIASGDRTGTPPEFSATRIGNFHYPQCLIYNLLSVERMMKREGNLS